jgi:hypothetical protein
MYGVYAGFFASCFSGYKVDTYCTVNGQTVEVVRTKMCVRSPKNLSLKLARTMVFFYAAT